MTGPSSKPVSVPDQLTVLVDSREQYPILFPSFVRIIQPSTRKPKDVKITVKRVTLDAGDYCLAEYPRACVIERKGSQLELHNNFLTHDASRQWRAFQKLIRATDHPVLVIECSPSELMKDSSFIPLPELLIQRLTTAISQLGLTTLFLPGHKSIGKRRDLGSFLIQYMIAQVISQSPPMDVENEKKEELSHAT